MANQEQLDILLQGVEVWNAWRKDQERAGSDWGFPAIEPDLNKANLAGMNLQGVKLSWANLWGANLQGIDLKGADLSYANLDDANLSEADLSGAHLGYARLTNTNLRNTNVSHAVMYATVCMDVDLSQAKGLETVDHLGSSSIYLDTILKSHGRIPEVFLRGAQGHFTFYECFIEYNRLLTGASTHYPFCLIASSREDEELAKRLTSDLQAHGVECWFDANDLRPGRFLSDRIVSPVRFYDIVVLILSKSTGLVEYDIEVTLGQEEQ